MKIWIDLGNSPHVPYFSSLSKEFVKRGHEILWTARDYAQTVELAESAGLDPFVIGSHGGKSIWGKGRKYGARVISLRRYIKDKGVDLAVSHNSHEPLAVARLLGIKSVTLMDYEHHPANHLSFRLANRVIVPAAFPFESVKKFGAVAKTKRFPGLKEDVYLAEFEPDPKFETELRHLGIEENEILIVVRPHASEALYHRSITNNILGDLLDRFGAMDNVKVVLLPRNEAQADLLRERHDHSNIIIPEKALDGSNLIAAADLVVSGGGTMNREAAAIGTPAATIFAGKSAAIDEDLENEGRLIVVRTEEDANELQPVKKKGDLGREKLKTKALVADLILED